MRRVTGQPTQAAGLGGEQIAGRSAWAGNLMHPHLPTPYRESIEALPTRHEEELDLVTLHNSAVLRIEDDPATGFR